MKEILNKFLGRNRTTSWFLYAVAALFTGILSWGFIMSIQQGLGYRESIIAMPTQLEVMWSAVMGMIFGGHEEDVNKIEKAVNIDLDRDGDIGEEGSPNSPAIPDSSPNLSVNLTSSPVELPAAATPIPTPEIVEKPAYGP